MKIIKTVIILTFALVVFSSCASVTSQKAVESPKFRGPFKLVKVDITDMKTSPYLINSIMFKVQNILEREGVAYKEETKTAYYQVELFISADYPAFVKSENMSGYSSLETRVVLKDPTGKPIKEGKVSTFNAFKDITSDFTEVSHARDIVSFITSQ
ncbi:MAG: hypothetical protein ACK4WB_08020 [Desulfatiglandales bacterium]